MGYFLFLLVNATLFIRPSEIFPDLATVRIYEALIIGCFVFSFPDVLEQLSPRALETRPITLGVLLIWILCGLSHVMQMDLPMAGESFYKFFKIVVYYLLLVGLVNTPYRLRLFLLFLGLFVTVLTSIAVLRYFEVITLTPPPMVKDSEKPERKSYGPKDDGTAPSVQDSYFDAKSGETVTVHRLRGTGIFNDPNDLCLALTFAVFLCLYGLTETSLGILRIFCLFPLGLFLFALRLTYSRGGLLGLIAGLGILFACRYGWRKTMYLGLAVLPLLLILFGGRMTTISSGEGTAQTRLNTWRDGLVLFKESPVFGVGMDRYHDYAVQVAHNSFLHSFTELGALGGIIFLGMFFSAFWSLLQVRKTLVLDPRLQRLLPFLIAMVVGYAGGIFTLSRNYDVPTYTILGLATAYLRVVPTYPPPQNIYLTGGLILRSVGISFAFMASMYVMVNLLVQ